MVPSVLPLILGTAMVTYWLVAEVVSVIAVLVVTTVVEGVAPPVPKFWTISTLRLAVPEATSARTGTVMLDPAARRTSSMRASR